MLNSMKRRKYPVNFEELENAEHDVVDVAKSRGLGLLRVVEPTGPVERDIGVAAVELYGGADGATGGGLTESEETVEDGTVLADVEALEVAGEGVFGESLGCDGGEEFDVVFGVEASDVYRSSGKWTVDLHPTVERVVDDEVVGHPDPVGLHRVTLTVVVVSYAWLVEVAHAPLLRVWTRWERRASYTILHYSLSLSLSEPDESSQNENNLFRKVDE